MAILLPSAAPPSAVKMWSDGISIYTEIGGYVLKFPYSEGGLSKALNVLGERKVDYSGQPSLHREPRRNVGTELQHAHAEAIMRRMGII